MKAKQAEDLIEIEWLRIQKGEAEIIASKMQQAQASDSQSKNIMPVSS